jgi:hypothetical protein
LDTWFTSKQENRSGLLDQLNPKTDQFLSKKTDQHLDTWFTSKQENMTMDQLNPKFALSTCLPSSPVNDKGAEKLDHQQVNKVTRIENTSRG